MIPRTILLGVVALMAVLPLACTRGPDAVSGATTGLSEPKPADHDRKSDALIIAVLAEGGGTAKIAKALSEILDAGIVSPRQAKADELRRYRLIGFGSGIFDQRHHACLLEIVDRMPVVPGQKAFIFSTSGVARRFALDNKIDDPHAAIRDKLLSRGFQVVGEFNCAGFNDNGFLKIFGGMNKGKPDAEDLERARAFAAALKESALAQAASP
jgi:flavodoxin